MRTILLTVFQAAILVGCCAQVPRHLAWERVSYKQLLEERGVIVTHQNLLRALNNTDVDIRKYAAMQLAQEANPSSQSALEEVLSRETDPDAKLFEARALTRFSSSAAVPYLIQACSFAKGDGDSNQAADALLTVQPSLGIEPCIDRILRNSSSQDPSTQINSLHLISRMMPHLSPQKQQSISDEIIPLLDSKQPGVGLAALHSLAQSSNPAVRTAARDKVKTSSDPNLRNMVEREIGDK